MSVEGLRVVRGPNWSYGNDDGGEGHVGTVTQDNTDDTLEVQWDMGKSGTFNSGKDGRLDLRILDSSPAGVHNKGINCNGCDKKDFTGTRWKCNRCDNVNLCTLCYAGDKHEVTHPFLRIDAPGLKGEIVPKRSASVKQSALGIFKNAEVKRGADWNCGEQDGGSGQIGIVQEVKSYTRDGGENNAVTVKWKNDRTNTYRLGYRGKVDLECVEETSGMAYYRDHLFPLSTVNVPRVKPDPLGSDSLPPPRTRPESAVSKSFKVGEKVCIDLHELDLKEKQRGHGGWSLRMKEYIGQHGIIQNIEANGDCVISYDGKEYRFNQEAIRKVPSLKIGDVVRILDDSSKVQALQRRHGGWSPEMAAFLGKVGKVIKIDSDGDVAVGFGGRAFVYNPACCEPAPGAKPMDDRGSGKDSGEERPRPTTGASGGQGKDDDDDDDDDGRDEAADALAHLVAQLFLLRQGAATASVMGPQLLLQAAANNDISKVKELLSRDSKLVNQKAKGLTALILASHEGHLEVVKLLVANGADLELTEDKGNNALMAALMKKRGDVAMFLIEQGANVNKYNIFGRNALHCAATNGTTSCLKLLLQKGCDINKQDADGDTPIHDAITSKENTCVAFLLADSRINLRLCNKKGFSPLHFAALKDDDMSVEKILAKAPELKNSCRIDGNTPLHIAAINDNVATVKTLLKAGVNVDAQTPEKTTPLHLACYKGHIRTVEVLVSKSADVTIVDKDGDTPLHNCMLGSKQGGDPVRFKQLYKQRCVQDDNTRERLKVFAALLGIRMTSQGELNERHQIACLLIKSGASVRVRNRRGKTPLEVCSFEKLTNAVKIFAEKHEREQGGGAGGAGASGRSQGRVTLAELLGLPIPCMVCMEAMADARFLPCQHKVCCKQCAFKTRTCPVCDQPIAQRVDLQGRRLVMMGDAPCKVQ